MISTCLAIRGELILLLFSRLISTLPIRLALGMGRLIGLLWFYLVPVRRAVALRNVERVFGGELEPAEKKRLVRRNFAHLATYAVELLRIPTLTPQSAAALTRREGWEHMEAAYAKGKGVILVTGHVGNIDLAGASMAIQGEPISVTAKDMGKLTREFVAEVRRKTGVILVPPRRSKEMIKSLLGDNAVVVLIVDQHMARHRAIACKFFGQWAATSPAPARFAFETGATIVPAVTYRDGKGPGHVLRFSPPLDLESPFEDQDANIRHNTERINRIIEDWVRELPEQWLWAHKRWKVQDAPQGWDIPKEEV